MVTETRYANGFPALLFIVISTLLVGGLLYIGDHITSNMQLVDALETENLLLEQQLESTQSQLEATQEQLCVMAEHITELEEACADITRVWDDLSNRGGLSRGTRYTAATIPANSPSHFSEVMYERAFTGTGLGGFGVGKSLVAAEEVYGVNGLLLASIIVLETGWGQSSLAKNKNNLAGINACGSNVYANATSFKSKGDCVLYLASLISKHYAPEGKYYGGSFDLHGIGKRYAEDPRWASKVSTCMRLILNRALKEC